MNNKLIYVPISEFGRIITGKTPKTNVFEFWNGDVPFITPTDIPSFDSKYLLTTERTISSFGEKSHKSILLPKNSLCVSCIATIGKLCLTRVPSITNQQINSIIINEKYNPNYLLFVFRYYLPYLQLIGGGTGSGTPIINKNKFSKLKYPVFDSLDIQKSIATVLDNYEQMIENNSKRINILEEMIETIYKEWFVRFRFYGSTGNYSKGSLPSGWSETTLGKMANIFTGKSNAQDSVEEGEYPLFDRSSEIKRSNRYLYECEAILVPGEGTTFYPKYYNGKFDLHQRCYCVNPKDAIYGKYIFEYLKLNRKYFLNVATGATVPSLRYRNFDKMRIVVPSEEVMLRFNKIINPIFDEINNLTNQNKLLAEQRDYLLPRLMSGKLSVEGKEIV